MAQKTVSGLKALVTGAGTRVGQAIAVGLAEAGCDVIVHYSGSADGALETVSQIVARGRKSAAIQADFRKPDEPERLSKESVALWGGVDILVNSASIYSAPETLVGKSDLFAETPESWDLALAINTRAPFFLIKHLAPALLESPNGNIINILDTSFTDPYLSRTAHTVSKWGLAAVSKLAAGTLAPKVRVNALILGGILPPPGMSKEEQQKNNWLGTDDVVESILFILRTDSINNETIGVRGSGHFRKRD